ncbi:hypothetical protein UT300003_32950 [Clostridium sardiniense]
MGLELISNVISDSAIMFGFISWIFIAFNLRKFREPEDFKNLKRITCLSVVCNLSFLLVLLSKSL